jgi:hypothetical protein
MKSSFKETEKFDALRAGLHVDDVDFKDAGTPKLIDRENAYWRRVVDTLEEDVNHNRPLCNRLRLRRRQVLSGEFGRRKSPGVPRFALGTAAGAAMFVAVGAWWDSTPVETASDVTRTASIESMDIDNAEFADNIDFYTWLEEQSDTLADSGGN